MLFSKPINAKAADRGRCLMRNYCPQSYPKIDSLLPINLELKPERATPCQADDRLDAIVAVVNDFVGF